MTSNAPTRATSRTTSNRRRPSAYDAVGSGKSYAPRSTSLVTSSTCTMRITRTASPPTSTTGANTMLAGLASASAMSADVEASRSRALARYVAHLAASRTRRTWRA